MDLVIMAAGMGSRFGGLKQIEPIDKNNNFIIDYSIYDAIQAGFNRIVFIVKEENKQLFEKTIENRIKSKIKVEYVFQKDLPNYPRKKPWGTAHAILACKDVVKNNFAVINADDFYGKEAFLLLAEKLKTLNKANYLLVGYKAKNTLSKFGVTKRSVIKHKNNKLIKLLEYNLQFLNNKLYATTLNLKSRKVIDINSIVSMNMIGFCPSIFKFLECEFERFLENNSKNFQTCEFGIPDVITNLIKQNKIKVEVLTTNAVWHGVTYKQDKAEVVEAIQKLKDCGQYPQNLWT